MDQILVVEDDPEVNRLLCELLHRNGYKTHSVECGLDAVRKLDSERNTHVNNLRKKLR